MVNRYLNEKSGLYNKEDSLEEVLKKYRSKIESIGKDDDLRKYFIWDYELFICCTNTLHIDESKENRLGPYIIYNNGISYPDINQFEIERKDFYEQCLEKEQNINIKIRYREYLLDYGDKSKKYTYACELIDLLINTNKIKDYNDCGEFLEYISKLSREIDIAIMFNMKDRIDILENDIVTMLTYLIEIKNYRWILEISKYDSFMIMSY